ncbi:MAG: hypothetical protein ACI8S7_000975 [Candidatus Krumholzibacteriia bacterium]
MQTLARELQGFRPSPQSNPGSCQRRAGSEKSSRNLTKGSAPAFAERGYELVGVPGVEAENASTSGSNNKGRQMKRILWMVLLTGWASVGWSSAAFGQSSTPDTLGFEAGDADTLSVSSGRVTVDEVVAAIARRREEDRFSKDSYEYTTLATVVVRYDDDEENGRYSIEESASRFHFDRNLGEQVVNLWERSREYENGELVEDETDEDVTAEFLPMQQNVFSAMPFTIEGSDRYEYEILARELVGNNLIYKVSYKPKSRFEALPAGVIWVDYTNWVIRKFEGELVETVPYPMILKSIPVFRQNRERYGDMWFTSDAYMRFVLRDIPFVDVPVNVEVRVQLRDIVINGVAYGPEDAAPGTGGSGLSPEEEASGFWLSAVANQDTLESYWDNIGEEWEEDITPEAAPISWAAVKADSLHFVGVDRLLELREGSLWRVNTDFSVLPRYNRTQGFVPRLGLTIEKMGYEEPKIDLTAGYAFSNERPVFGADIELPLLRSRWTVREATEGEPEILGSLYKKLSLDISGRKDAGMFAGDNRRDTRSVAAFFYGSDPNHYYEERSAAGDFKLRLARKFSVTAGGGYAENRAWSQRTSWNVLGRRLRPDGNASADFVNDTFARVGASWRWGVMWLGGDVTWHDYENGAASKTALREVHVAVEWDVLDKMGNQWVLRADHREFDNDEAVPVQWKSWQGDYGSLRGYRAGELVGTAGAQASLDLRFGFDLWKAVRFPGLKKLGLQPIGFVDWAKTWGGGEVDLYGPESGIGPAVQDYRMDVGFGFGKRFDIPGMGEFKNVRLYGAHPVGQGSEGHGWRVLLAFEK